MRAAGAGRLDCGGGVRLENAMPDPARLRGLRPHMGMRLQVACRLEERGIVRVPATAIGGW